MTKAFTMSRRGFIKVAGITAGCTVMGLPLGVCSAAEKTGFVEKRQQSVYKTDAEIYKIRKSQDNPMIKKLYDPKTGFFHDGPGGHLAHHLLHTHYNDRSGGIKALKAAGFKLNV